MIDDDSEAISGLLDEESERELAEALRAAWNPSELDPALNDALIEFALEDPLAEPSPEEIAESQRLREALDGHGSHPDAALAEALRAASAPSALSSETSKLLVDRTLKKQRNVIYVAFGAVSAVAAVAAGALMLLQSVQGGSPGAADESPVARGTLSAPAPLALSRSTSELFPEKFVRGKSSARMDRIAHSRAADLRANRYKRWGVR